MANQPTFYSDAFYLRIARDLEACQLVEYEIKLYLSEAFELIRKCVGDKLAFSMNDRDIENSSLERLITLLAKYTDNFKLVKQLNRFKDKRNTLAHRGIAQCLDPELELDVGAIADLERELGTIRYEAEDLRIAIREEGNKFRPHLYFDSIPDPAQT
jgi:hypothetical protein